MAPDDLIGGLQREGNPRHRRLAARPLRNKFQGISARVVLLVGDQQLITRVELKGAKNGVDADSGAGNEHQVLRLRAQELRQRAAGVVE